MINIEKKTFVIITLVIVIAFVIYKKRESFKSKKCIVNQMDEELYKFATKRNCNKKNCALCDLKFKDDEEVVRKINTKHKSSDCIVGQMEDDVSSYMKKMMII